MQPAPQVNIDKSRLSDRVARQLELAIKAGRYLPGELLPSERHLSKELGVSRPVLREALRSLEAQDLIRVRQGKGTLVTHQPIDPSSAAQWLTKNAAAVRSFYEARLVLEPELAALASQRITAQQLAQLRRILQDSQTIIEQGTPVAFVGLDIDFHSVIAQSAGNPHLEQMLSRLINPDADVRRVIHRLPGHLGIAHARHERIFTAIERRDAEGARQAMRDALTGVLREIDDIKESQA